MFHPEDLGVGKQVLATEEKEGKMHPRAIPSQGSPNGSTQVFDILVPGDFPKEHHRRWDAYVTGLCGGMTILSTAKGHWLDPTDGNVYTEKMIPVRVACTYEQIRDIAKFTKAHYQQKLVMFYKISDMVWVI